MRSPANKALEGKNREEVQLQFRMILNNNHSKSIKSLRLRLSIIISVVSSAGNPMYKLLPYSREVNWQVFHLSTVFVILSTYATGNNPICSDSIVPVVMHQMQAHL